MAKQSKRAPRGSKLNILIKSLGDRQMRQDVLSDKTSIDPSRISGFKHGKYIPTNEELDLIKKALGWTKAVADDWVKALKLKKNRISKSKRKKKSVRKNARKISVSRSKAKKNPAISESDILTLIIENEGKISHDGAALVRKVEEEFQGALPQGLALILAKKFTSILKKS